ncbi:MULTISPECIES: hypothetical protein [unclassified Pseudoalteromonas]|uniref:hypothetical protein n=1 Tax=unclassified Pseudoalteromonas TaxID=194690 RepID=UPI00097EC7D4|nr:hypothetical protein [Pseudoalteromonas sp. JB197]PCC13271.1 hypothetical protein CIK86_08405 [Pseudoalteromonas sp. JB197]SJN49881.1 hypothetical protein CZ797_18600 [Pseudoalteromonas sp. JB197]
MRGKPEETDFTLFCERQGIVCSKPEEDTNGWDRLLEYTFEEIEYKVYVQVKAMEGAYESYRGRNVKLSNMLKFGRTLAPCFFVFVETKHNHNTKFHLVHYDKKLLEKTLRKKTQLESEGKDELHKINIKVNPKTANEVVVISNGDCIKSKICQLMKSFGKTYKEYISYKSQELESLGYEDGRYQINMKFEPQQFEKLIFGEQKEIQVEVTGASESRFGITLTADSGLQKLVGSPNASLVSPDFVPDSIKEQVVHLDNNANSKTKEYEFDFGEAYFPIKMSGTLLLSPVTDAMKLTFSFFSITYYFENHEINLKIFLNEFFKKPRTLFEIKRCFKLLELIEQFDFHIVDKSEERIRLPFNSFKGKLPVILKLLDTLKLYTKFLTDLDLEYEELFAGNFFETQFLNIICGGDNFHLDCKRNIEYLNCYFIFGNEHRKFCSSYHFKKGLGSNKSNYYYDHHIEKRIISDLSEFRSALNQKEDLIIEL